LYPAKNAATSSSLLTMPELAFGTSLKTVPGGCCGMLGVLSPQLHSCAPSVLQTYYTLRCSAYLSSASRKCHGWSSTLLRSLIRRLWHVCFLTRQRIRIQNEHINLARQPSVPKLPLQRPTATLISKGEIQLLYRTPYNQISPNSDQMNTLAGLFEKHCGISTP
jgi:hypothetical protein